MMVTRILFKAHPAFWAQALAVFPAHRLERQGGHHCVPQRRLEIDQIALNPPLFVLLFFLEEFSILIVEEFLHFDVKVVRDGSRQRPHSPVTATETVPETRIPSCTASSFRSSSISEPS